jgi:hypothetical protein
MPGIIRFVGGLLLVMSAGATLDTNPEASLLVPLVLGSVGLVLMFLGICAAKRP